MKSWSVVTVVALSSVLFACGGGGGGGTSTDFAVSSTSWTDGGTIDVKYSSTVGAANTSPALALSNIPSTANYISVVMDDETAPCGTGVNACTHWSVINLPSTKASIGEGEDLSGVATAFGQSYAGNNQYDGPNPPNAHTYKVTVYAHKTASTFATGDTITRAGFVAAMGSDIVASDTWTGTYTP